MFRFQGFLIISLQILLTAGCKMGGTNGSPPDDQPHVSASPTSEGSEHDAGGTAKPPRAGGGGACNRGICPTAPSPQTVFFTPAGPRLPLPGDGNVPTLASGRDNGFAIVGQIQSATVNGGCSGLPGQTSGGTITVNGVVITVPTNTIVQFPANTYTFADGMCPLNNPPVKPSSLFGTSLAFDGSGGTPTPAVVSSGQMSPVLPSLEVRVVGNIVSPSAAPAGVGSPYVAALIYISQMEANIGSGYIAAIDYNDGSIYVSSGTGGATTRLMINDPIGRFGRQSIGPDPRFSVDTSNPTIKSGSSGYPMCVPRFDPAVKDDPRCPQRNRPKSLCRTFAQAGLTGLLNGVAVAGPFRIPGADIPATPPLPGGYCTAFVMKAIKGMPGSNDASAIPGAVLALPLPANEPDPREQVPFEVGDFITWRGTLVRGGNTPPANPSYATTTGDLVWAHTIEANVGAYTQPRTLPAYIAINEMVVGVDPLPTGLAIVGVETTARLILEAVTTDVASIVDVYFDDKGFEMVPRGITLGGNYVNRSTKQNAEYYRWITPESMTGSLADQSANKVPYAMSAQPFGGGIESQYMGPQPGRARIRANKIPAINTAAGGCTAAGNSMGCAVTQSPTRYIRAVLRSLCAPAATGTADMSAAKVLVPSSNLDATPWYDINGAPYPAPGAPAQIGYGPSTTVVPADEPNPGTCLEHAQFANGLYTGQYMAPVGEYIFPENTLAGLPVVPANTYDLGFLVYGENGLPGASTGPQQPKPW